MGAFTEEPDLPAPHMQAGAHPVAFFSPTSNGYRIRRRQAADARECVLDNHPLHRELPRIGDMRVHASAAERVRADGTTIPGLLLYRNDIGVRDTAPHTF